MLSPFYLMQPVKKKKSGEIVVKYDSNRLGSFSKSITVHSNAKNSPVRLTISGNVEQSKQPLKSEMNLKKQEIQKLDDVFEGVLVVG